MRSELVDLQLLKPLIAKGHEMLEFQHQSRMVWTNWQRNLVPGIIGLAPIGGCPVQVKLFKRSIFLCQEFLKEPHTAWTVAVTIELIVNLPTNDMWIGAKLCAHRPNQASHHIMKLSRIDTIMIAVSELNPSPVLVNRKNVWVLRYQPC